MAEARRRDAWERTAALMALLANCHRDPKKTPAFKVSDFDPFTVSPEAMPVDLGEVKFMFTGREKTPVSTQRNDS